MPKKINEVPIWLIVSVAVAITVLSYCVYTPPAKGQDRICETVCEIDGWGRRVCKTVCRDNELSFIDQ
jgi:hypothetical protein